MPTAGGGLSPTQKEATPGSPPSSIDGRTGSSTLGTGFSFNPILVIETVERKPTGRHAAKGARRAVHDLPAFQLCPAIRQLCSAPVSIPALHTCPSSQPLSLEGFGVILRGYSCLAPRPAPPRLVPHRGLPHIYQGITGPSPEEYLAWPWGKLQWHRRSNRHSRRRAATQGAAPRRSSQPARYDPGMGRPIAFHPRGCIITRSQGTRSA